MEPANLYKYREDSARTEHIIASGNVWLSTADKLNDPLECKTGEIPDEWKREKIREMENAQLQGFVASAMPSLRERRPFYSLSYRAARNWFERFRRLKTRKEKYQRMRRFLRDHGREISDPRNLFETFERQLRRVGIFSLSARADSQLMWAHYAGTHTGLALGFRRNEENKLGSPEHTFPVKYEDKKPEFSGGFVNQVSMFLDSNGVFQSRQQIGFNDETFRAAFTTKPRDWKYEEEWRYVEETSGLFPLPGAITQIVFGLRMSAHRRKHYAQLVCKAGRTVELFEVIVGKDQSSFILEPWSNSHGTVVR